MRNTALKIGAGVVIAGLALTGCTAEEPESTEPVDLVMTTYTSSEEIIATYQALADEFRETNPRLGKLTIQTIPQADYVGQLTIQMNGGEAPDFGWMTGTNLPAFADAGLLADLTPLKSNDAYDFDDIVPNLVRWTGENGELWGHPFANTVHPIAYNKDVFAAAGVDTPLELHESGEWTWENLRRISKELVDAGVVTYGFDIPSFAFTNLTLFELVLNGYGAQGWPDGESCGYTSSGSEAAFQLFHDMIFADGSYPGPGETSSFPTGDTAMFLGAPSALSTLVDVGFEFEVVPQPQAVDDGGLFLSQAWMVAFADGKDPELATELLAHMMSAEGAAQLQKFYVPPRESLLTAELVAQLSPQLTPEAAQRASIDPLADANQPVYPVAYPELESAILPILDTLWSAEADVAAVLAEACAAAEPILAKG